MARPTKGGIKPNAEYLKEWDDFQANHKTEGPILLPISVSIEDGEIARDRIKAGEIAKMKSALMKEFKAHCDEPGRNVGGAYCAEDFDRMLGEYIEYFSADGSQGPRPPSPLDFNISRPVWFMFQLPRKNWAFSEHKQYSMENDMDDFERNCEKVCTLDDDHILLLANHCRSAPKGLKYNLHVTISQIIGKEILKTDIIIDPGINNDGDW